VYTFGTNTVDNMFVKMELAGVIIVQMWGLGKESKDKV
jgi:hypothetical protein